MEEKKGRLHSRNRNRGKYDFDALVKVEPTLLPFVKINKSGGTSIDYLNPAAVKLLNKAILHHYYNISYWEFSDKHLCPPIPGRADYLHCIADLLSEYNDGVIPRGKKITCLDIGVGASCIYPIIGMVEYGWSFIGADIDPVSIKSAQTIVQNNSSLKDKIELRLQKDRQAIFRGIIRADEKIDLTICNPPFHATREAAEKGTLRKLKGLTGNKGKTVQRNFSGNQNELVYEGGEYQFIANMIMDSHQFAKNCFWFSTLVSKQANLKNIYKSLNDIKALEVKTIPMGTGNKTTRIVAWTFLTKAMQKAWKEYRWKS